MIRNRIQFWTGSVQWALGWSSSGPCSGSVVLSRIIGLMRFEFHVPIPSLNLPYVCVVSMVVVRTAAFIVEQFNLGSGKEVRLRGKKEREKTWLDDSTLDWLSPII